MKIFSIRSGFHVDHSSTSYEFYAVDKPLNSSGRKAVASLSSRARPSGRRVSFIYHGEWNDLPCHWRQLMEKYYDVMYSESYDWWILSMAFNSDKNTIKKIKKYEFSDCNDLGISVDAKANRVIIKVTPIVKTKYQLRYSYTFILETVRSLPKYISAGGEYPKLECSLSLL